MGMEAIYYYVTLVITTYQAATCTDLENHNINIRDLENLKFQILHWLFWKRVSSSESGRGKNRAVESVCL
jgi:hypothetical protein